MKTSNNDPLHGMIKKEKKAGIFFTYILRCSDDTLYVGATQNLEKRLHEHNNLKSGAHYTKIRRPVELVYFEEIPTLAASRAREAELKKLKREEKIALVNKKSSQLQ